MINEHICSTYSYKMYLFLPSKIDPLKRVYFSRNSQIPIFLIFSLCLLFGIALLAKFIHLENLLIFTVRGGELLLLPGISIRHPASSARRPRGLMWYVSTVFI